MDRGAEVGHEVGQEQAPAERFHLLVPGGLRDVANDRLDVAALIVEETIRLRGLLGLP